MVICIVPYSSLNALRTLVTNSYIRDRLQDGSYCTVITCGSSSESFNSSASLWHSLNIDL